MSACPGCGGEARPLMALLLAAPVILGAAGAAAVALAKGSALATPVLAVLGAVFLGFVAWTLRLGLRIWSGQACGSCGRSKP